MLRITTIAVAIAGLALSAACTRNDQNQQSRNSSSTDTTTKETREQPGQLSVQPQKEKGSGDVAVQKETVTTERKTEKEKIPTVEEKTAKADINRMDKDDFVALGLSEQEANSIVQYRKDHGNFTSVDQLKNTGINQAWLSQNSSKLGVS